MAGYSPDVATTSPEKRYVAIVEVVLFSIIQLVQFSMRYNQEWRYWHHRKQKHPARCFLRQSSPNRRLGHGYLQSPSKQVNAHRRIRSANGQAGRTGPGNSRYPNHVRFLLHFFRFPVIISIVLVVVGECIGIPGCMYAGGAVFAATFCFVCGLVSWLAVAYRSVLSPAGHRCVLIVLGALPFLVVRVVYFLLAEFGPRKFSPIDGSEGVMVGMELVTEIFIVIVLLLARAVAEPLWPVKEGPADPEV